jgi:iron complex transport system substrate-binding protein
VLRMRSAVSLVPSATDILVALGAGELLVGISADCDQPDPAAPRPVVTRPMIDPALAAVDPSGVDASVREQMAAGGLLYTLDVDLIATLAPDVVFAQDECSVCALPSSEVRAVLARRGVSCEIVSLDPVDLEGVLSTFSVVGQALGLDAEGAALEAACRARLGRLAGGDARAAATRSRPRVVVLDWVDPPFVAGNWVPDLVRAAGGEPLLGQSGTPSRQSSLETISTCGAEVMVVAPCGLDLEAAGHGAWTLRGVLGERAKLTAGAARAETSPGTGTAEADRGGPLPRIIAFDGRLWFSRPGPRLVEGAEALAAWLAGAAPSGDVTSIEITGATR